MVLQNLCLVRIYKHNGVILNVGYKVLDVIQNVCQKVVITGSLYQVIFMLWKFGLSSNLSLPMSAFHISE